MDPAHFKDTSKSEKAVPLGILPISEDTHSAMGQYESHHYVRIENDDERLLARLGYFQQFRREFTKWSTRSYAISILGVLGSQPATYGVPLSLGGSATAIWAWAIGSLMAWCIACSVAELVSAYPTAGGMYFVTKEVVPQRHVPIWSWTIGWCNFLGQACGVASIAYTIGQMILAMVSMNSEFNEGRYGFSPTPAMTVGLSIAVLVFFGLICSLTTRALHRLVLWFAPINVAATVGICIALGVLTPNKRDASFVFTDFRDGSGWGTVWSFFLGFLNVAWVMTDYDGTTHMSEEQHDASVEGPTAIRLAIFVSGILGLALNITFGFCLTENYMDDIVGSPTGLPVAQIFLNAGGPVGGSIILFLVILIQVFTGASAMLANARMTFAFARDRALPLSRLWSTINRYTQTPVAAVWFVVLFCACLNMIGFGSTLTITAIFNLCAPCLDLSYIAVIFARRWYSKEMSAIGKSFQPGHYAPSNALSKTYNTIAIVWVLFISGVLFSPTSNPITSKNMNYAIVVAGSVALASLSWWYIGGARHYYAGPQTHDIREQRHETTRQEEQWQRDHPTEPPSYGTIKLHDGDSV